MIFIRLQSGEARNQIQNLGKLIDRPRPIIQAAVRGARTRLQRHFTERNRRGNRLGGRRTHFWLDIRKSTQVGEITERQGFVIIGDVRFNQKLHGGTLKPKEKKALTIPVHPEAHGRRAEELERLANIKLFVISARVGPSALLAAADKDGNVTVYYLLRRSVTQAPDPEALPPGDELELAAVDAAREYVQTVVENAQPRNET